MSAITSVYSELFMTYPTLMRASGFFLLVSGWGIVPAAFSLLHGPGPRAGFVLAGVALELLGFVLIVRSHGFTRRKKS